MIRSVALIIWVGIIFLFTCSESMEQLLQQGVISFTWSKHPNMTEFWYPLPTTLDATFISRKLGHALSFFILSILVFLLFLSKKKMLAISLLYAVTTEVLQLFFRRGGRIFDIGFDGMGVEVALIIVASIQLVQEKSLTRSSQT
jgi:VanZ family protein